MRVDHATYQFHHSVVLTLNSSVPLRVVGCGELLANEVFVIELRGRFADKFATPVCTNNLHGMTCVTKDLPNCLLNARGNVGFLWKTIGKATASGVIFYQETIYCTSNRGRVNGTEKIGMEKSA